MYQIFAGISEFKDKVPCPYMYLSWMKSDDGRKEKRCYRVNSGLPARGSRSNSAFGYSQISAGGVLTSARWRDCDFFRV